MKKFLKKLFGKNRYIRFLYLSVFGRTNQKLLDIRKEFYSQFLKKGDLFFDVGANYGNRIEPLIPLELKIIAIEPQAECVRYLKLKYGKKISIVQMGIGAGQGEETMFISDSNVVSSFSKEWISATKESRRFGNVNWIDERKIPMTTLDKLIQEFGIPKFIKIDVEGYELEVLEGLSSPIDIISFEYTVPEQSYRINQCIQRLRSIMNDQIIFNYSVGESMIFGTK